MTQDEILKFKAGRDLDLLVAKYVMHQENFDHPGFHWAEGTTEDGQDGWGGFECPRCHCSQGNDAECVLAYSNSIAAAMNVVEKLYAGKTIGFQVLRWPSEFEDWCVEFGNGQYGMYVATADTLPLGICRAALLAVAHQIRE